MTKEQKSIYIKGARVHNLKNIEVEIPHNRLVVITGLSGSGKSTLAFDTIFAEGQRRYVESLSAYARQFLGKINKPDVDVITGIAPAIAIEQKVNTRNPRSTVGTTTELYDYLKLLYARIGHTFSPVSGQEVKCYTEDDVAQYILSLPEGSRVAVAAPLQLREGQGVIEKTDPGAGRRHPACTCGGRDSADRGFPAPRGRKHPCRRYLDRSRSCQSFAGRRPADPPAGFRSPCFLLWKRGLPNRHARRRQRVLGPFRGRRHRIRASDRTSVQLQQPAGRLPDVRRLRQDHRHRRGPGDSRQTQNHLRGRRGLLARRDHAGVERPARSQCL